MNTTMADGASERLDAQIADALFGQPGMSKMDVANRLRELRGDGAPVLANVGNPVSPSPAGHGDAPWPEIDMILADAYSAGAERLQFEGIARRAAVRAAVAALAARQPVGLSDTFQHSVSEWMDKCFLPSLYSDMTERGDRLLEEVLELLQAHGYDKARVPTLVDYVFSRPVGDPAQEVGGVMVTLAGYCWVAGLDMHVHGHAELARISHPEVMAKIRVKQEAKNALHFDTPLPGNAAAPPAQAVELGTGVKAIADERERQLQAEGFSREGDQQYQRGELARAATAYVQLAAMDLRDGGRNHIAWHGPAAAWPWAPEWWKPVDARRDLVRAGALIAAQIDLIDSKAVQP